MIDNEKFNIRGDSETWLCPVCGFGHYYKGGQFDSSGGMVGTGICSCCLFEPGFDDVSAASGGCPRTTQEAIRDYRKNWIAKGMPWCSSTNSPMNWDAKRQLTSLFKIAPFLDTEPNP